MKYAFITSLLEKKSFMLATLDFDGFCPLKKKVKSWGNSIRTLNNSLQPKLISNSFQYIHTWYEMIAMWGSTNYDHENRMLETRWIFVPIKCHRGGGDKGRANYCV